MCDEVWISRRSLVTTCILNMHTRRLMVFSCGRRRSSDFGWASRAYFSSNGSIAIEIALKMAFLKFSVDHVDLFVMILRIPLMRDLRLS
ncbi:hypothetical protein AAHE18_09G130800 [Arachis hypogaea]